VVFPSTDGVQLADDLFELLEKVGARKRGFVLPQAQLGVTSDWQKQIAMEHDISRVILEDRASSRDAFLVFAEREFGLKLGSEKEHALPLAEFLSLPVPE